MKKVPKINACIKGHLEPTHLKSSPLFTFSTKSLGQDSPSIHLFSKIIGSRFTTAKIKLGEDSSSWFVFLGQDSLSKKENNKTIKRTFVQDSPCFKYYYVKIHHVQKWNRLRFTNPEIYIPQDSTSRRASNLWRSLRKGSSRCPLTAA